MTAWTALSMLVAAAWLVAGIELLRGIRRIPDLAAGPPPPPPGPDRWPYVSVIVPARNEAGAIRASLESLLGQDYPRFEVIAVDDRSADGTGAIMDSLAAAHPALQVIHIRGLPPGWLGKTHALHSGYRAAAGEWVLFTDGDVLFHPQCLRRAVTLAEARGLDHLTVFPSLTLRGFWEKALVSCFAILFNLKLRPWRAADPRSKAYVAVGAFNLVRRSAYERIGTHQALALEVLDDVQLGWLIKRAGLRQEAAQSGGLIRVRWQEGLGGIVSGLTKNAFAGLGYRVRDVGLSTALLLTMDVFPFVGLLTLGGGARLACLGSVVILTALYGVHARHLRVPAAYVATHPLAALLFIYIILRSTTLTLSRGGVVWRGTWYPLDALRK